MIDTDKYEGHTPAPWKADEPEHPHYGVICIGPCKARVRRYQNDRATEESWYADALLITDAPLLLAEVKRLREGIKKITRDYDFNTIKSRSRTKPRPAYNVPAGDGIHTVTFHQKACLKILELIE